MKFHPIFSLPIIEPTRPKYVVARQFVDRALCGELVAFATPHMTQEQTSIRKCTRYCHVLPKDVSRFYDVVAAGFVKYNIWGLHITGILRPATLLHYTRGFSCRKHTDYIPGDLDYGKISSVTMLSKRSDFVGGDLFVDESEDPVPLDRGDTVFFPSTLMHHVSTVKRGNRRIIAVWASGPPLV